MAVDDAEEGVEEAAPVVETALEPKKTKKGGDDSSKGTRKSGKAEKSAKSEKGKKKAAAPAAPPAASAEEIYEEPWAEEEYAESSTYGMADDGDGGDD